MTASSHIYAPPSLAEQNARFYSAMLTARRAGKEHFTLGVVTEPCTDHPRFIPARPLTGSLRSPAGQVADCGAESFRNQRF